MVPRIRIPGLALWALLGVACTGKLVEPSGAPGPNAGAGTGASAGAGGGAGAGGAGGSAGNTTTSCTASSSGHVGLQRLTSRQIENTLTELLGVPVTLPEAFPRDDRLGNYVTLPEPQLMSSI